jgi:hypothetical protein
MTNVLLARMSRKEALNSARIAGYHDNIREYARVLVESNVGRNSAEIAWFEGQKSKQRGDVCRCGVCSL